MVLRLFCNNRQSESTHPGAARDPPDQRRSTPVTRARSTILNTSPLILGRNSTYRRVGMLHSGAKLWHIAAHFEQRRKGALWPPGGLWPSSGRQPWGRGMVGVSLLSYNPHTKTAWWWLWWWTRRWLELMLWWMAFYIYSHMDGCLWERLGVVALMLGHFAHW